MHHLFHNWNNNAEEDGDITLTDDSEAISPPPKKSEERYGENFYADAMIIFSILHKHE